MTRAPHVSEFILEGPKELLKQIQEQHGQHYDEIAGVATVPPPPQEEDAAVATTKKGPIRVASLTHISEGCVARP